MSLAIAPPTVSMPRQRGMTSSSRVVRLSEPDGRARTLACTARPERDDLIGIERVYGWIPKNSATRWPAGGVHHRAADEDHGVDGRVAHDPLGIFAGPVGRRRWCGPPAARPAPRTRPRVCGDRSASCTEVHGEMCFVCVGQLDASAARNDRGASGGAAASALCPGAMLRSRAEELDAGAVQVVATEVRIAGGRQNLEEIRDEGIEGSGPA